MINELNNLYDQELLIKQTHSTKDLIIWNYSRKVQYENLWNVHPLILKCRGLVTNIKGEIVGRCLPKFFNYDQLVNANYPIPNEPFTMTDKMDGQYGGLFFYDGEWILTSRGSFESVYAKRGFELLQKYDYKKLSTDYSYIFEIIFKEGRIVLKYDYEDLVMLACINIETGIEKSIYDQGFEELGFKLVKKYDGINDFKTIKTMIANDAEGYVIQFKSGFRMKIKGDEYCRLHAIITEVSSRDVWKYLKEGLPLTELLENVPDEFDAWVKEQVRSLQNLYQLIDSTAKNKYYSEIDPQEGETRKDVALRILKYDKNLHPIFFHLYDGKDYAHIIWNKIYPKYSKPFTINDEEGDEN
jgi:RNA ligase